MEVKDPPTGCKNPHYAVLGRQPISENKIMDIILTQPDASPSLTFNSWDQRRKPDRRKSNKQTPSATMH